MEEEKKLMADMSDKMKKKYRTTAVEPDPSDPVSILIIYDQEEYLPNAGTLCAISHETAQKIFSYLSVEFPRLLRDFQCVLCSFTSLLHDSPIDGTNP